MNTGCCCSCSVENFADLDRSKSVHSKVDLVDLDSDQARV